MCVVLEECFAQVLTIVVDEEKALFRELAAICEGNYVIF